MVFLPFANYFILLLCVPFVLFLQCMHRVLYCGSVSDHLRPSALINLICQLLKYRGRIIYSSFIRHEW